MIGLTIITKLLSNRTEVSVIKTALTNSIWFRLTNSIWFRRAGSSIRLGVAFSSIPHVIRVITPVQMPVINTSSVIAGVKSHLLTLGGRTFNLS